MKAFVSFASNETVRYPEDALRIKAFVEQRGTVQFQPTLANYERFWQQYSEDVWCAGYMEISDQLLLSFVYWLQDLQT